jgi:hypothetical protein
LVYSCATMRAAALNPVPGNIHDLAHQACYRWFGHRSARVTIVDGPAPPQQVVLRAAVTPDAKIAWAADQDQERAGFEILWRKTTESRWQVFDYVGSAEERC